MEFRREGTEADAALALHIHLILLKKLRDCVLGDDLRCALPRLLSAHDQPEQRRLASAVWSEDCDPVTLFNAEINVREERRATVAVRHAFERDHLGRTARTRREAE